MTTLAFSSTDSLPADGRAATALPAHFGLNLVAHALPAALPGFAGSAFAAAVAGLGGGAIRYPGGTVTEQLFDPANENAAASGGTPLIPQAEAIAFAARTGATLDLVLQTRSGFDRSAAAALLDGTYGQRGVCADYLARTADYVRRSLQDAAAAGVQISSLEIGNEFIYGGEMTAGEYGRLSRAVLAVVSDTIDATLPAGAPQPRLLVQTLNSAGRFSPLEDSAAWVSGDMIAFEPVVGWQRVTVPAQGTAAHQARVIADQITGIQAGLPDLSGLVDGLVGHDYNARGHRSGGDQPPSYMFAQFDRQEARLGFAPGTLSRHVTEWNVRAFVAGDDGQANDPAAALNRGLPQAGLMVEMVFQFLQNGVDAAHVWPVYFAGANTTNLLAAADYALRIPGAAFRLMQESLPGLAPVFEGHHGGAAHQLDSFGYAADGRMVLFVTSRLGTPTDPVTLDLGDAVGADASRAMAAGPYFVAQTMLSATDAAGLPSDGIRTPEARPRFGYSDGQMALGDLIALPELAGYGMVRIEVTFVTPGNDLVQGRGGDDRIRGLGGDDTLLGDAGDDRLEGMEGDDLLAGGAGDDLLSGGAGDDRLRGEGGNDRLTGGEGDDTLNGGTGRDRLAGGAGDDVLTGGGQADLFVFEDGFGRDRITDFRRSGADRIDLSALTGADAVAAFDDVLARLTVEGPDQVIVFAGGRIVLEGTAGLPLSASDFLF